MLRRFIIAAALIGTLALSGIGLLGAHTAQSHQVSASTSTVANTMKPYPGYVGG